MPHIRTHTVVFFHCTSQKVHTEDASRPNDEQAPHLPGNIVTKPRRVKTCERRKNTNKCTYDAVDDCTADMARDHAGQVHVKEMNVLDALNIAMQSRGK
jgi:hypothetical protein